MGRQLTPAWECRGERALARFCSEAQVHSCDDPLVPVSDGRPVALAAVLAVVWTLLPSDDCISWMGAEQQGPELYPGSCPHEPIDSSGTVCETHTHTHTAIPHYMRLT